jgi:acetolactate synthase-1/2/3 large subunit
MDIETAAREKIPVTVLVINNSGMGGYKEGMPTAFEKYGASGMSGDYAALAVSLGADSCRVENGDDMPAALEQARKVNESGKPFLIEVITAMENRMSKPASGH